MNSLMLRYGRFALLILILVTVLAVPIALHTLITAQPTTLTTMLAVRMLVSGCHAARSIAVTGTLRASIATDDNGRMSMEVDPSYDVSTILQSLSRQTHSINVERNLAVVDNSAMFHRPVAPRRVGTLVTRVNLPC